VLLLLAGFAVARVLLVPEDLPRTAIGVGAFALAAALFLAWLFPVVREAASFTPTDAQVTGRGHGLERYPRQFIVDSPSSYHLAPIVLTRSGPVPIAALALVPVALLAARFRWAALVLGGTITLLALLLLDPVFPRFADAVSLSQARRLAGLLPFAFALAGGAAVLARLLSWAVLPVALVAGIVLEWRWPGDFGYVLREGGPTLPVWIAALGGALALVAAVALRNRLIMRERTDWLPAAACALFVLPLAFTTDWERPTPVQELTSGLVAAVREHTRPGEVVLSDPETSYWLAAQAPVYVAVSTPSHVGDTKDNRPYERVQDWQSYLRTGVFPGPYDWIVIDRRRVQGRDCAGVVYADLRYALCSTE
jgi:hypothetical protein